MKPSERIKQIKKEIWDRRGFRGNLVDIWAIIQYLDEEWEKNKPCQHKRTEVWDMEKGEQCKECKKFI